MSCMGNFCKYYSKLLTVLLSEFHLTMRSSLSCGDADWADAFNLLALVLEVVSGLQNKQHWIWVQVPETHSVS